MIKKTKIEELIPRNVKATSVIQEGEMYIWPSSLLHTVYPFFGNEVRRSIAWNGTYRVVDKKTKLIVAGLTKNN